jgi:hypothetical protein
VPSFVPEWWDFWRAGDDGLGTAGHQQLGPLRYVVLQSTLESALPLPPTDRMIVVMGVGHSRDVSGT